MTSVHTQPDVSVVDSSEGAFRTNRTLRLLSSVCAEAQSSTSPGEFASQLAEAFVEHDVALAATVWLVDSQPNPAGKAGDFTRLMEQGKNQLQGLQLNGHEIQVACRPISGDTSQSILTAPLGNSHRCYGFVTLLIGAHHPHERLAALQGVRLVTQVASTYLARTLRDRDLEHPYEALFRSLDLETTGFTVVNELRHWLKVDRVSLLIRRSRRFRMQASSGQVKPDARSNVVRQLESLGDVVGRWNDVVHHPRNDLAPQLSQAIDRYVDVSPAMGLTIIPLRRPSPRPQELDEVQRLTLRDRGVPYGVLVLESFQGTVAASIPEASAPIRAAETALHNALTHHQVFLLPVWQAMGKLLGGSTRWKLVLFCLACVLTLSMLIWVPATHWVYANGTLQPKIQRHLFARTQGIVSKIHARHGQVVTAGDPLVELENSELAQQWERVLGEQNVARQRLIAVKSQRLSQNQVTSSRRSTQSGEGSATFDALASEEQQLESQLNHLARQQHILEQARQDLIIRAPMDGTITTWDIEQLLESRPVSRGQRLMTIAAVQGPWQLELELPEQFLDEVEQAQEEIGKDLPMTYILGTTPDTKRHARLERLSDTAESHERLGVSVKVTATLLDPPSEKRAGTEVRAKIECGRRSSGYVWFHDAWEYLKTHFLFYTQ